MINGLITAIRTLSIIPVPGKDAEELSDAVVWFGFVGFLLGIILFLSIKGGLLLTKWPEGIAGFAVFLSAAATRGIHLDGLADFSDGFGGGHTKEKILTIMKDSNIGTFGALSIALVLLFKWISIVSLIKDNNYAYIVPIYVSSRLVMSFLSSHLPYARKGEGTGKPFVENASKKHSIYAFLISFFLVLIWSGVMGVYILFIGMLFSLFAGSFVKKKIGGITGDILGASCEITETLLLFLCAACKIHSTFILI